MYQKDPACRSFNTKVLSTLLGIVLENMGPGKSIILALFNSQQSCLIAGCMLLACVGPLLEG